MAFDDTFRLSCHGVITNNNDDVLLLKASYGKQSWGLPGGAIDPGETIHEALIRECREELACLVDIQYLSGVYFHQAFNSQVFIFRCLIREGMDIELSEEHTQYQYSPVKSMAAVQQQRVNDCLAFNGQVVSAKF